MSGKKTGLFISPINEPIVNRVMEDYGYTKISNAINFIIQEYDKLTRQDKKEVELPTKCSQPEEKNTADFSGWFVAEDK